MQGSFFLGNGLFEVREMVSRALGAREVKIKNMAAGVCGTDVHIAGGEKGSAAVVPPVILGHEYAGIVEETGSDVHTVRPGDHVTVDPNRYCGRCRYCRSGQKQYCENMEATGVTENGGFAEYSYVPEAQVFKLNPALSFEEGAMAEPLACCIHGIQQVPINCGDTVCVVGGGAIGLLMVQLARLRGAGIVILSEPMTLRRQTGLQVGADAVLDPLAAPLGEQLNNLTGRMSADVVIECAGNISATRQAFAISDRGARILLFSVPRPDAVYELPLFDVFRNEWKIYGSFVNPDTHLSAVRLLDSGKVSVKPLITHRYPLKQVREAILRQQAGDAVKVLVLPNGA
jgi:threonine dehydrogenase-like Zn-dependent dehydrogenase